MVTKTTQMRRKSPSQGIALYGYTLLEHIDSASDANGNPYLGFLFLWNVHRYGRLMRPKPLQKPISASNAFHNNAVGYDAIILSGTVNRSRRRDGGVSASIAPTQR